MPKLDLQEHYYWLRHYCGYPEGVARRMVREKYLEINGRDSLEKFLKETAKEEAEDRGEAPTPDEEHWGCD